MQAEQLLTDARAATAEAQAGYAAAHQAALDAGWQPAELTQLGYPPFAGRRRRAGTASAVDGAAAP